MSAEAAGEVLSSGPRELNFSLIQMTRGEFLRKFGAPNSAGRYSWSGRVVPKYGESQFGQILEFDESMNLLAKYCREKDSREGEKPPSCIMAI